MADTLEPCARRDNFFNPFHTRRLRDTPLRDLVRFRITGRLNWRGKIAAANLPAPIASLIVRVVRRSRLWRIEKAAVAEELIAHFVDALAAGVSVDDVAALFGDADAAARLIRRSKIRNRPLSQRAMIWAGRVTIVGVVAMGVSIFRYTSGRPTVRVDYLGTLNAPIERVPQRDRAWPIYRPLLGDISRLGDELFVPLNREEIEAHPGADWKMLAYVSESDPAFARLTGLIDRHGDLLEQLRAAAAKPALGCPLGEDPALRLRPDDTPSTPSPLFSHALATARSAGWSPLRGLGNLFAADARVARHAGDGARLRADIDAMLGFADQIRGPMSIDYDTSFITYRLTFEAISTTLIESPQMLGDDEQLEKLARRVGTVGGETASSLMSLEGGRARFRDLVQRLYTDDGHGDGRLTTLATASDTAISMDPAGSERHRPPLSADERALRFGGGWAWSVVGQSRRATEDEMIRLTTIDEQALARPLRDVVAVSGDEWPTTAAIEARYDSAARLAGQDAFTYLWPAGNVKLAESAEQTLGMRDGALLGIALERYRRTHGAYPPNLAAVESCFSGRLPVDRITGEPLKYRFVGGTPLVYSVGVDRDDDGGRAASYNNNAAWPAEPTIAARWFASQFRRFGNPLPDGDWLVFGSHDR